MTAASSAPASAGSVSKFATTMGAYMRIQEKRERNRLAAERCRNKKVQLIRHLQLENERLRSEIQMLHAEVMRLRENSLKN